MIYKTVVCVVVSRNWWSRVCGIPFQAEMLHCKTDVRTIPGKLNPILRRMNLTHLLQRSWNNCRDPLLNGIELRIIAN